MSDVDAAMDAALDWLVERGHFPSRSRAMACLVDQHEPEFTALVMALAEAVGSATAEGAAALAEETIDVAAGFVQRLNALP